MEQIKSEILSHMDFPKKGINFQDITGIFQNPQSVRYLIDESVRKIKESGVKVDAVAGLESRGFLLGVPLALALGVPFIIIRKKGKLPGNLE